LLLTGLRLAPVIESLSIEAVALVRSFRPAATKFEPAPEVGPEAFEKLPYSELQIGRKFGEHIDPSRPGYRTHMEYLERAQEIYSSEKSSITKFPMDARKYPGETHYQLENDLLRLDPKGKFRSLYPKD
jgi:hypothetical protein